MAVLHALLRGDVDARSRPELADSLTKHPWLGDQKLMLVPYHLIGAESLVWRPPSWAATSRTVRREHPMPRCPSSIARKDFSTTPAPSARTWAPTRSARSSRRRHATTGATSSRRGPRTRSTPPSQRLPTSRRRGACSATSSRRSCPATSTRWPVPPTCSSLWIPAWPRSARTRNDSATSGVVLSSTSSCYGWPARSVTPRSSRGRQRRSPKLVESSDASRAVPIVSFIARQRDLRES